jgi:hypothetical protein
MGGHAVGARRTEQQPPAGNIEHGRVDEGDGLVARALDRVGAGDGPVQQRALAVIDMGNLVVGHQRDDVDAVQAGQRVQRLEALAARAQIGVRDDLDVADIGPAVEGGAHALECSVLQGLAQGFAMRGVARHEGQSDPDRQAQPGNRRVGGFDRQTAVGVQKRHQAAGDRLAPLRAPGRAGAQAQGQQTGQQLAQKWVPGR